MFDILSRYKHCGYFEFKSNDELSDVCNAPNNKSGVYIVWDMTHKDNRRLLYIGRSGKKKNGIIIHRTAGLGGIKDRLVNGHQFGKNPRKKSWTLKMVESGINKLSINWFDTEDDDPQEIEDRLLSETIREIRSIPLWNKQGPTKYYDIEP